MSYVNKKIRVFKEAGDIEIRRKRSDGRMKTYQSAFDARAWCDSNEDRRQYILELIRQGDGKSLNLGKYIPIEVIIEILLANKNAEIERLKQIINNHKKLNGGIEAKYAPQETRARGLSIDGTIRENIESFDATERCEKITELDSKSSKIPKKISGLSTETVIDGENGLKLPAKKSKESEDSENIRNNESSVMKASGTQSSADTVFGKTGIPIRKTSYKEKKNIVDGDKKVLRVDKSTENDIKFQSTVGTDPGPASFIMEKNGVPKKVSKGTSTSVSMTTEKEKTDANILAREKQVYNLKEALKEKEKLARLQHEIAVAAIEQLENIKKIVESEDLDAIKAVDEIKNLILEKVLDATAPKALVLSGATQVQQENVQERTDSDEGYGKEEFTENSKIKKKGDINDKSRSLNDFEADCVDLKKRLDKLKGLEDIVKEIRKNAFKTIQAGDSKEKDNLLVKNSALEREIKNLKSNLNDMEVLEAERNALKLNLNDLNKIQNDYGNLLNKTKDIDAVVAERDMYKSKYDKLKNIEADCDKLKWKVQRIEELENERKLLLKEIQKYESIMTNQENEIKRLACQIKFLTRELDNKKEQIKAVIVPPVVAECGPTSTQQSRPESCISQCRPKSMVCYKVYQPMNVLVPTQSAKSQPHLVNSSERQAAFSVKKMIELENKLLLKQHQAKQKIDTLQSTVERFKKELDIEKQRNNDLVNRYTNQSKTVSYMKIEMDMTKRENDQDKKKLKHLNMALSKILKTNSQVVGPHPCRFIQGAIPGRPVPRLPIPHFHTTMNGDDNKYRYNYSVSNRPCPHQSAILDSFEIDE